MANLSKESPASALMGGASRGTRNASAIQGILQNKERMEREEDLHHLRKEALQTQGAIQGLQLEELETRKAQGDLPWNPEASPLFQTMDEPLRKRYLDLIENNNIPLTQRGRAMFREMVKSDTELYKNFSEAALIPAKQALATAQSNYKYLLRNPQATIEELTAAKAETDRAYAEYSRQSGDIERERNEIAVLNFARNNATTIKKSPALKSMVELSKATGDTKGLEAVIKEMAKAEGKGLLNQWETFLQAKMAEAEKTGKTPDGIAIVKEYKNLSKDKSLSAEEWNRRREYDYKKYVADEKTAGREPKSYSQWRKENRSPMFSIFGDMGGEEIPEGVDGVYIPGEGVRMR